MTVNKYKAILSIVLKSSSDRGVLIEKGIQQNDFTTRYSRSQPELHGENLHKMQPNVHKTHTTVAKSRYYSTVLRTIIAGPFPVPYFHRRNSTDFYHPSRYFTVKSVQTGRLLYLDEPFLNSYLNHIRTIVNKQYQSLFT
ncbi:hypothetical protein WAI453_008517 [Rhynchosporium graminicola]